MSETMVERVTKVVREKRAMSLCALCDRNGHMIRCTCEEIARAAIEAIRNADNDMLAAMHRAMFTDPYDATNLPMLGAGFEAAIDAALSPNKETDR